MEQVINYWNLVIGDEDDWQVDYYAPHNGTVGADQLSSFQLIRFSFIMSHLLVLERFL